MGLGWQAYTTSTILNLHIRRLVGLSTFLLLHSCLRGAFYFCFREIFYILWTFLIQQLFHSRLYEMITANSE